jgi:uncharacterized membrane protein YphA (DoxX/SURF4 family)
MTQLDQTDPGVAVAPTPTNGGMPVRSHSRVTGTVRLLLSLWLIAAAVRTLADPEQAVAEQHAPLGVLLPLAGLLFTLGVFLLTGFMSRVAGLILVCLGVWQSTTYGVTVLPAVEAIVGLYLMLRGGGAWAMDIYVQKMQDRARRKAAISSPESS